MLAMATRLNLTQVSTWFANARRRLKKENRMTWAARSRVVPPPPPPQAPSVPSPPPLHPRLPTSNNLPLLWARVLGDLGGKTLGGDVRETVKPPTPQAQQQQQSTHPKIWSLAELVEEPKCLS